MDQWILKTVVLAVLLLYMGCMRATASSTNKGRTKQQGLKAAHDSQNSSKASSEANKFTKEYTESSFGNYDKYTFWNFIYLLGKTKEQLNADINEIIHDVETDLNISGEHILDQISEMEQIHLSELDSRAEHDPVMRSLSLYAEKAKKKLNELPNSEILKFLIYITVLNEAKQSQKELTEDWYFHFLGNESDDFIQLISQYHITSINTKSINLHVYLGFNDDLKFLINTIMQSSKKTKVKEEKIKWIYILSIIDSKLQSKEVQNVINKLVKTIQRSSTPVSFSADDILQYMLSNGVRINGGTKLFVIRSIDAEATAPHSENYYLAKQIAVATEKNIREVFGNSNFTNDMEYFLSIVINNLNSLQNNSTEAKWVALLKYLCNTFSSEGISPIIQQGIQKLVSHLKENNTATDPLQYVNYIQAYIQNLNIAFLSETLKNYSKELDAKIEKHLKSAKVSKTFSDDINYLITVIMAQENTRNIYLQESWFDILKSIYAITATGNFTGDLQSSVHTLVNNLKKMNGSPWSILSNLKEKIESLQTYFQRESPEKAAQELSAKIETTLMAVLAPEQLFDDMKYITMVVIEQMNNTNNEDLKQKWIGILKSVYNLSASGILTIAIQDGVHDIANNLQEMNSSSSILSYLEEEVTYLLQNKQKGYFVNYAKELALKIEQFLEKIQVPRQLSDDIKYLINVVIHQISKSRNQHLKQILFAILKSVQSIITSGNLTANLQHKIHTIISNLKEINGSYSSFLKYLKEQISSSLQSIKNDIPNMHAKQLASEIKQIIESAKISEEFADDIKYITDIVTIQVNKTNNEDIEQKWVSIFKSIYAITASENFTLAFQNKIHAMVSYLKEINSSSSSILSYLEEKISNFKQNDQKGNQENSLGLASKLEQFLDKAQVPKAFSDDIKYFINVTMNQINKENKDIQKQLPTILKSIYTAITSGGFKTTLQATIHAIVSHLKHMNGSSTNILSYLKEFIHHLQQHDHNLNSSIQQQEQLNYANELATKIEECLQAEHALKEFSDDIKYIITMSADQLNTTTNVDEQQRWVAILKSLYSLATYGNLTVLLQNNMHTLVSNLKEMNDSSSILNYLEEDINNFLQYYQNENHEHLVKELVAKIVGNVGSAETSDEFFNDVLHLLNVTVAYIYTASNTEIQQRWLAILISIYTITASENSVVALDYNIDSIINGLEELDDDSGKLLSYLEQQFNSLLQHFQTQKTEDFLKEIAVSIEQNLKNSQAPEGLFNDVRYIINIVADLLSRVSDESIRQRLVEILISLYNVTASVDFTIALQARIHAIVISLKQIENSGDLLSYLKDQINNL